MPTEVVGVVDKFFRAPTIPAGILADPEYTEHGDMMAHESFEALRASKLKEGNAPGSEYCAHGIVRGSVEPSLRDSILAEGVREKVNVRMQGDKFYLSDGHHRVFCAADVDPGIPVPVNWR